MVDEEYNGVLILLWKESRIAAVVIMEYVS